MYVMHRLTTYMWSLCNIFLHLSAAITPFVALSADQSVLQWACQFIVSSKHFNCTISTLFFQRDDVWYLLCTRAWMVLLLRNTVTVRSISGQWRSLSLALSLSLSRTSFCSPMHSPTFQSFTHPLILFLTLLLYFILSLSLSFFLSFSPLHSLSGFLSVLLCLHYTHTRAHAVTHTHSLSSTHSQKHARSNPYAIFLAHSHTFLYLSLSFLLSLSLSYTHAMIHTHIRTHTLSHLWTRSSTHSLLSRMRAALSSACVRARALFSLFLSPFLPFLFFSFPILSVLFSSSPLSGLLPRRLCPTRSLPLFSNSW